MLIGIHLSAKVVKNIFILHSLIKKVIYQNVLNAKKKKALSQTKIKKGIVQIVAIIFM